MIATPTPRYLELEILARARAWHQIDATTAPDAKAGALEALVEALTELERLTRKGER